MLSQLDNDCRTLTKLHHKYIVGSAKKAIVINVNMFICNFTYAVSKAIDSPSYKVYITSKAIKHLYDKKPAVEYDFILINLHKVIKYPDHIYLNKQGKRGNYCFTKTIDSKILFCSLEIVNGENKPNENEWYVVTAFWVNERYLKNYTLTWSWKGGMPSS